ncbi:tRNA pseudouridine13 synthase [Persephonella hydrogeniphila]|uniref:tRNA pseudouridine13 synthase n=1 Tax=Persephonella hydrogeniphila TaxID=198703 RepID=A0A285MY86_9AQUI|nr:tRNA pseudouridine(13) synthase TruD [Persephonella hydrogeniphila]SNZ02169.1 tRNA pseudouridine13 synthase [Persephonella hydrogeniphila]
MKKVVFNWDIKEKPEDFIVKEIASFDISDNGNYYLYQLIKRNMNTQDVVKRYGFGYAGLKDKNALTFQYVSSERFLGETIFERVDKDSFYALIYKGRIRKKIKIGNLKGNKFSIKLKGNRLKEQDWFINYFDLQRVLRNKEKGKKLLKQLNRKVKLKWLENFYIDAYLSHLWNKSLMFYLQSQFSGYFVEEKGIKYFIPFTDFRYLIENFPKFWTIPGYKVKIKEYEKDIYSKVLEKEGFSFEEFIQKMKNLGIKGDYRKTFLRAEDIYIKDGRIYFFLPKGSYATMFLKSIFIE